MLLYFIVYFTLFFGKNVLGVTPGFFFKSIRHAFWYILSVIYLSCTSMDATPGVQALSDWWSGGVRGGALIDLIGTRTRDELIFNIGERRMSSP